MSLLLLFRSRSVGSTTADTHDGGGHYLQDYRILTESEWRERFGLKKKAIELQPVEIVEAKQVPVKPVQGVGLSELEEARARYLYAAYKASTLRENLDKLRSQIAIQEMLSFEKAQKAINERALSIAIADLEKKYLQEERARVQAMKLLEELDSEDFMINLLLH